MRRGGDRSRGGVCRSRLRRGRAPDRREWASNTGRSFSHHRTGHVTARLERCLRRPSNRRIRSCPPRCLKPSYSRAPRPSGASGRSIAASVSSIRRTTTSRAPSRSTPLTRPRMRRWRASGATGAPRISDWPMPTVPCTTPPIRRPPPIRSARCCRRWDMWPTPRAGTGARSRSIRTRGMR